MADAETVKRPIFAAPKHYAKVVVNAVLWVVGLLVRIASLPVVIIALVFERINPVKSPAISEQSRCPACGHAGCRLNYIETIGAEKGAVERTCYTCGAKAYSATVIPVERWAPVKKLVATASRQ